MSDGYRESRLTLPVTPGRDHIRGSVDAPVSLVEHGDYECPFCALAHPVVEALRSRIGALFHLVYRHFPIKAAHPHAERAAEAAEAAGAQGYFWAMHALLLANQQRLTDSHLLRCAEAVGADLRPFQKDLLDRVHLPKVREDFSSGVWSGVNGTPTFFVNGLRHDGRADLPSLLGAIQGAARASAASE